MTVNENIRRIRLSKGIQQRQLAKSIGVSSSFVAQVEAGVYNFSVERLIQVADVLDCSLDELTGREFPQKDN